MNDLQAKDEIRLIQEMIERTKKITAGSWMFFLVWGIVVILAIGGMYALVSIEEFSWIWLNWVVFVGIGVVFSIVYGKKLEKLEGARTYANIATDHVCFACGIAFILVSFIFPLLKLYSWGLIPVLISMVAGILVFTLGGIFEWNLLKWCGVIWWLGAVGLIFIHENYRALLVIPLLLIGYIMPAVVLRSIYQKQRDENAS
jgi:hypothetical protein